LTSYRDLRGALDWFRREWQAELPERLHESAVHVDDLDHLGGPIMTERFKDYIGSGVMWVGDEVRSLETPRGLLRQVLSDMARGSLLERQAARFLFLLACRDFDPESTGLAMRPPITFEYSPYYAEKALGRLRQRMEQREQRKRQPWQMTGDYRTLASKESDVVA